MFVFVETKLEVRQYGACGMSDKYRIIFIKLQNKHNNHKFSNLAPGGGLLDTLTFCLTVIYNAMKQTIRDYICLEPTRHATDRDPITGNFRMGGNVIITNNHFVPKIESSTFEND